MTEFCTSSCVLYQKGLRGRNTEGKCKYNGSAAYPSGMACVHPLGPQEKTTPTNAAFNLLRSLEQPDPQNPENKT